MKTGTRLGIIGILDATGYATAHPQYWLIKYGGYTMTTDPPNNNLEICATFFVQGRGENGGRQEIKDGTRSVWEAVLQ
ncbi:hypothetical protein [Bradyrhizobium sp. STM 3562]|uniref:hypothetical protein n=1 Tax=Bradyrhizobium sp. STM 3562 TaxID=578924 RepID=UPI00388D8640